MLITALILILFTILLARKDGISFLLKEKHQEDANTLKAIKQWHLTGTLIYFLFVGILIAECGHNLGQSVQVIVQALLIRLSIYDFIFNYTAKLDLKYLGSTAWVDKIFVKIFGQYGAVKKSVVFLLILIITLFLKFLDENA